MNGSLIKHIFFLTALPVIASVNLMLFAIFYDSEIKIWGLVSLGLIILSGITPIWRQFAKVQTIEITKESVIIDGLRIDRSNVLGWRFFQTSSLDLRGRYIELKLAKTPSSRWVWRLAKLFERVPTLNMVERRIPLGKEPRIIVSLRPWDAKESEITQALENSKKPELPNEEV